MLLLRGTFSRVDDQKLTPSDPCSSSPQGSRKCERKPGKCVENEARSTILLQSCSKRSPTCGENLESGLMFEWSTLDDGRITSSSRERRGKSRFGSGSSRVLSTSSWSRQGSRPKKAGGRPGCPRCLTSSEDSSFVPSLFERQVGPGVWAIAPA